MENTNVQMYVHAPAGMVSRYACVILTDVTLTQAKRACRGPGRERESGGRVVGGIPMLRPSRTAQERERKHYKT